jgi:hypothetical protein
VPATKKMISDDYEQIGHREYFFRIFRKVIFFIQALFLLNVNQKNTVFLGIKHKLLML